MKWETVAFLLITYELFLVNLLMIEKHSIGKYKRSIRVFIYLLLTIIITLILYPKISSVHNGNGLFILIGMIYVIPSCFLYTQSPRKTLVITFSSLIYTALCYTISAHITTLFFEQYFISLLLIIQTILLILAIVLFYRLVKSRFEQALQKMNNNTANHLLALLFLLYIFIVLINYSLIMKITYLNVISFLILGICTSLFLSFVFRAIDVTTEHVELGKMAFIDEITGIPNRNQFLFDCDQELIFKDKVIIAYIDLDQFKSINDNYSHAFGDKYLRFFAEYLTNYFKSDGKVYRLHGDEFIVVSSNDFKQVSNDMKTCLEESFKKKIVQQEFLGFSYGIVTYPDDSKDIYELLNKVDLLMYKQKRREKNQ